MTDQLDSFDQRQRTEFVHLIEEGIDYEEALEQVKRDTREEYRSILAMSDDVFQSSDHAQPR